MGKVIIPIWKKWLSHIKEFHIESAPSDLNPHLYVSLYKGRLQLSTDNAIYSYEDLYDNFGAAFKLIDWDKFNPKRILVLGGGMLSVPYLLEKYKFKSEITVVEYDEEVIYLASKYMLDKISRPIQLIHADAKNFVDINQEKYDLIIVDVFNDDIVPTEIEQPDFLNQLKTISEPNTLILYNRLSRTLQDLTLTKGYYNDIFAQAFPESSYFDVQGNWILTNTARYNLKSQ